VRSSGAEGSATGASLEDVLEAIGEAPLPVDPEAPSLPDDPQPAIAATMVTRNHRDAMPLGANRGERHRVEGISSLLPQDDFGGRWVHGAARASLENQGHVTVVPDEVGGVGLRPHDTVQPDPRLQPVTVQPLLGQLTAQLSTPVQSTSQLDARLHDTVQSALSVQSTPQSEPLLHWASQSSIAHVRLQISSAH